MKRIVLFILFAALIGGATANLLIYIPPMGKLDNRGIPLNYYNRRCIIPLGMPVETWLTAMKWFRVYEIYRWDCSQMATFTEWALENCGYETEIVTTRVLFEGKAWGHAYVRVKIKGVWYDYETTSRRQLISEDLAEFIGPTLTFKSIYSLWSFSWDRAEFYREWAWWRQYQRREQKIIGEPI